MTILQRVGGLTLAFILVISAGAAWAQKAPKRSITKIAGDLYRFQNNFHFSVFYVTPAGVLVTDPINAGAGDRGKKVIHHGSAADGMHHFWQRGTHPRSLACGKNNGGD